MIKQNPVLYFFLTEPINRVVDVKVKVYKLFKIEKEDNLIMTLLTTEVCLIYDNNFDDSLTSVLSRELDDLPVKTTFFRLCNRKNDVPINPEARQLRDTPLQARHRLYSF